MAARGSILERLAPLFALREFPSHAIAGGSGLSFWRPLGSRRLQGHAGVNTGAIYMLELSSELGRLSLEVETTLFRILQESLKKVHRHSGSPRACIHIDRGQASVTMEVQDEGKGMQQGAPKRNSNGAPLAGVGIAGMRERVRQLGGQLEIHSTPSGTTVKVVLPLS